APPRMRRVGRPPVRPGLASQEHVLELVHAGVAEQKRRILGRNEGGGRDAFVPALFEKAQELLADPGSARLLQHGRTSKTRHYTKPPRALGAPGSRREPCLQGEVAEGAFAPHGSMRLLLARAARAMRARQVEDRGAPAGRPARGVLEPGLESALHLALSHLGGRLDSLKLEFELVRVAGAAERLFHRDQLLLEELEDRLVERLHAVLRGALGDRLV